MERINNDEQRIGGKLTKWPLFLNIALVPTAMRTILATDISEQISIVGQEASGIGNMKLAMNGVLYLLVFQMVLMLRSKKRFVMKIF